MYKERNSKNNRLYSIWVEFRRRCRNPRTETYQQKNLTYENSWNNYLVFRLWAISNGYTSKLSLERKDNSVGYYPQNCKFATKQEQQYNRDKRDNPKFKSIYIGVSEARPSKRMTTTLKKPWRARVCRKGKEIFHECFATEIESAKARDKFCIDNNINVVLNFSY